jgi:UDP-4-amino-4,6-dideoxy-N-acetyl-beta-L-altrosamine N-acetyltransferase
MGGSDHSDVNIKILKILRKFNLKVNIVTTSANKNLIALKKYVKGKDWINLYIDSKKIAKLMRDSDGAIVSPSVSVNEVDFMGLKLIAIKTASNQKDIYKYLTKHKYLTLKKFNKQELKIKIKRLLHTIKASNKEIKLINFTKLNIEDKKIVLAWRNNPEVKRWMYNNKDISLENHLKFIDSLKNSDDKRYFIIKQNHKYIGVIDFTNITKISAEFGLYSNVKLKGVGKLLLSTLCDYGFEKLGVQKLIAKVFETNQRAINLYTKFNFKVVDEKTINDKKVICMELKNEDR